MKKTLYFVLYCFLLGTFISCSKDDNESLVFKLKADKKIISPFEPLTVTIDLDTKLLINAYDSIIWEYNGTWWNGIITIPAPVDDAMKLNITDHRLGLNKVRAIGYKNGEVTNETSMEYEVVKPVNDFLTIKWGKENQGTSYYMTPGRIKTVDGNPKRESIRLSLHHFLKKEGFKEEYAILGFMPMRSSIYSKYINKNNDNISCEIEDYDFFFDDSKINKSRLITDSFWHDFITSMYGTSVLRYEDENPEEATLWNEYNKRFKNPLGDNIFPWYKDVYPVEIWDTPTAHICLFAVYTGWYYVIAEPRN